MTLRRAHVLGAGISGVAAAEWLLQNGWMVIVSDDRLDARLELIAERLRGLGAEVILGGHQGALAKSAQLVVVSPGMPLTAPAIVERRRQGSEVIGEFELGWRQLKGTVASTTGANGKSTTVALLGKIFEKTGRPAFTAGNIGLPVISLAGKTTPESLISLEVSSYQLESVSEFHPHISSFLNLTPDHIERHSSLEGYGLAKSRIWMNQSSDDWLVFNADDPMVVRFTPTAKARKAAFSLQGPVTTGAWADGDLLRFHLPGIAEISLPRSISPLPGRHNTANILAAGTMALLAGVSPDHLQSGVESFGGLPHRLERVRELRGVAYVNDSKATNCDAARWALEAVDTPVIFLAGGKPKGGGFGSIREFVAGKVRRQIFFGQAANEMLSDLGDLAPATVVKDLAEAVGLAQADSRSGDTILLAPCCASFDQYQSFVHRGDHFRELVMALK